MEHVHSGYAYNDAFEAKRIYLIALFHRAFCFAVLAFFGGSITLLVLDGIVAFSNKGILINALDIFTAILGLCLIPLIFVVAWYWVRLRSMLYGKPLYCVLVFIVCAAMPFLFIFDIIASKRLLRQAYHNQNIDCGFWGLPDKDTLNHLKIRALNQ